LFQLLIFNFHSKTGNLVPPFYRYSSGDDKCSDLIKHSNLRV
jgi:hypothetical protein